MNSFIDHCDCKKSKNETDWILQKCCKYYFQYYRNSWILSTKIDSVRNKFYYDGKTFIIQSPEGERKIYDEYTFNSLEEYKVFCKKIIDNLEFA